MKKEILKLKFNKETVANLSPENMNELKGANIPIDPCSYERTGCSGEPCYYFITHNCYLSHNLNCLNNSHIKCL